MIDHIYEEDILPAFCFLESSPIALMTLTQEIIVDLISVINLDATKGCKYYPHLLGIFCPSIKQFAHLLNRDEVHPGSRFDLDIRSWRELM